jgi:hypothetical protein
MKTTGCWQALGAIGIGVALVSMSGCQTNVAGMTLPSGHYLQHPPQYFPPSPPFPLPRELAQQQGVAAGAAPVAPAVGPLPAPVVPPPGPAIAPPPVPQP